MEKRFNDSIQEHKTWISTFRVKKNATNEEVLQMIYHDLSAKCDFIKQLYPFSGGSPHTYTRMEKFFASEYIYFRTDGIEFYNDNYEDSIKAFENGIFHVGEDFFGRGEWPIVIFGRISDSREGFDDSICYTISR